MTFMHRPRVSIYRGVSKLPTFTLSINQILKVNIIRAVELIPRYYQKVSSKMLR